MIRKRLWTALLVGALATLGAVGLTARAGAIIGGAPSNGSYPFIAALYSADGSFTCGGTLVAPDAILTANHCMPAARIPPVPIDGMTARIGSNDRTNGGSVVGLTGLPQQVGNADMVVVRLSQPISNQVATLADWTPNIGDPVVNVGWGSPGYAPCGDNLQCSLPPSQQLMELNSTTIGCPNSPDAWETCNRANSPGAHLGGGDSGSPLLVRGGDGSVRVAGVATGSPKGDELVMLYVSAAYLRTEINNILTEASPQILPPSQVEPPGQQLPVG